MSPGATVIFPGRDEVIRNPEECPRKSDSRKIILVNGGICMLSPSLATTDFRSLRRFGPVSSGHVVAVHRYVCGIM